MIRAMKLSEYLESRGESAHAFALRAGIKPRNIYNIVAGSRPMIDIANRIVLATRSEPAPDGSTVRFEDLVPEESAA